MQNAYSIDKRWLRTLYFLRSSVDRCADMSFRRVVLSEAKCALRCFLRELLTAVLNFILDFNFLRY